MNEEFDRIRDEQRDEMRPEYDFTNGVRGKYFDPRNRLTTLMRIDKDVVRYFQTSEELNAALRTLIAEGRVPEPRNE